MAANVFGASRSDQKFGRLGGPFGSTVNSKTCLKKFGPEPPTPLRGVETRVWNSKKKILSPFTIFMYCFGKSMDGKTVMVHQISGHYVTYISFYG